MLIDAHCHPYDLSRIFPEAEEERKKLGVTVVSSACDLEEFEYCEKLDGVLPCFGIHPQMGRHLSVSASIRTGAFWHPKRETINKLASEKRIAAIGEFGFDLFNNEYKSTEKWQDEAFASQLEIAIKYELPVILHVRRAMHKIFSYTNMLKKCESVIFHSWSGTYEEGQSLLRRGVNAYFSFGNTILTGHKQQVRSCIHLPVDRLLTETDAPYQPPPRVEFSSWKDVPGIIKVIAALRGIIGNEIEIQIETNFKNSLCSRRPMEERGEEF